MIVVYSVDSNWSFRAVDQHMINIDRLCQNENVLKFLVGNKCDLEEWRRVSYIDLYDKGLENQCSWFETSTLPEFTSTIDELFKVVTE